MSDHSYSQVSRREKLFALYKALRFRPRKSIVIVVLSVFSALLEGIGIGFILPIARLAQQNSISPEEASGLLSWFLLIYDTIGIPFTLEFLILGVVAVLTVRFMSSFLVSWFRSILTTKYIRHLQSNGLENALEAEISYFDVVGSDEILNAIVTQAELAGALVGQVIEFLQNTLLVVMYLGLSFLIAPKLTLGALVTFGGISFTFHSLLEPAYSLGDKIAEANEMIQEWAQAGTQGIRDIKLFRLSPEVKSNFGDAVDQFTRSRIKHQRNQEAIANLYQLGTAVMLFILIWAAIRLSALSLSSLGVFLVAMFRLGPKISGLNSHFYSIEGRLPHLVRTQRFVEDLKGHKEQIAGGAVPDTIETLSFDDVSFSYESAGKLVLNDLSFTIKRGEFVGFVGPSGAGKSTIVSLLVRLYNPDSGTITANGNSIADFDLNEWRSRIAFVSQDPYIFNDTLRRNLTIGNRDASQEQVERVCEIARVTEFLSDLPDGFETKLGDDGARLSGGQRQRVAIARALLKKDCEMLVLDEATSELDTHLEEEVQANIEEFGENYTMVVIAHRLSTVTNADRIYVMGDGQIIESGSHSELRETDGKYAELYDMQTGMD